jgi:pantoate--beta-alanine ligase
MGEVLEGASRPGHFDGVLTVVLKLFQLVRPDLAVFGEKDAQQLALIRRLVSDLDVPVRIVGEPTVREADGLALSSRNRYLSSAERASALAISRALRAGKDSVVGGPARVLETAHAVLDHEAGLRADYVALVRADTFSEVPDAFEGEAVLAVAAYAGTTRLIDNVIVNFGGSA